MKYAIILLLAAFNAAFAQGIRFEEGTFADAVSKAKAEGKLVFVDAYTTWCGPCKWLAREVFPNEELGKFYNKNFVSLQIDMEKGEGIEFARKYAVKAFPTLIYFDSDGNEIHRLLGARDAARLLSETQDLMVEENRFSALKKRMSASNSYSKSDLRKYLIAANQQGDDDAARMEEYMKMMTPEDWKDEEILSIIIDMSAESEDCSDPFTRAIFSNYNTVITALATYPEYQSAFREFIYEKLAKSFAQKLDDPNVDASVAEEFLKKNKNVYNSERIQLMAQRMAKKNENNHKKLLQLDNEYYMKYVGNPDLLNNVAWQIYENPDATKKELKYALAWARKSVSISEGYHNTDTLAHLLYRTGKRKEARTWAERAIEIGRSQGEDVTLTEILLSKLVQTAGK